jgi:thiamine-monophosphate kinase
MSVTTSIQQLGEFGLIQRLTKSFASHNKETIRAVGDDAAVIDPSQSRVVITTDMLVEGIHFDRMYTPLKHLGYKSVVVNLSDVYAMNAIPKQITVSLAVSSRYTVEALEEIYAGIALACSRYQVDLVGGDTTSSTSGLIISVTALGFVQPEDVVYRSGAKPGDLICVSGDLGAAYLGLQLLEREKRVFLESGAQPDLENQTYLIERQLKPEARKDVIAFFADQHIRPTAMIDISDGLSSDLLHICTQSQVGCLIEESRVPVSEEAYAMALKFNIDPITCALSGGEDYELLFTIEPEDETKIAGESAFTIIGEIVSADQGTQLRTKGGNLHPLKAQGWNHFG